MADGSFSLPLTIVDQKQKLAGIPNIFRKMSKVEINLRK